MNLVAIDFETANPRTHSACAVGLVGIDQNKIAFRKSYLIRPPESWFAFTHIHGITWQDVKQAPTFDKIWDEIEPLLSNADYLLAHNASFDRRVLKGCCEYYKIPAKEFNFVCTVQLSRNIWNIYPTKLSDVCRELAIPLQHHEALSDANACAQIALQALEKEKQWSFLT